MERALDSVLLLLLILSSDWLYSAAATVHGSINDVIYVQATMTMNEKPSKFILIRTRGEFRDVINLISIQYDRK